MEEIKQDIKQLSNQINDMNETLKEVLRELKELKTSCSRMDTHISFVENVYDTVKSPFSRILNRITGNNRELPEITNGGEI